MNIMNNGESMKGKAIALALAGCMAFFGLSACSSQQEPEQEEAEIVEEPAYELVIGNEDAEVVNLPMTNGTDKTITGLQVKGVEEEAFSANLMRADQAWEPNQTADVFFADVIFEGGASKADGAESSSSSKVDSSSSSISSEASALPADDLVMNEAYDLQFTESDGTIFVLHQLVLASLADAEDITVNIDPESGQAYLAYVEEGDAATTLEAEKQIAAAEAAAAQAEAEAQAQAAAEAAAEAAKQSQSKGPSGSGSRSGGYDSVGQGSGGSGSGGSAPAQSEDNCIDPDDIVLN